MNYVLLFIAYAAGLFGIRRFFKNEGRLDFTRVVVLEAVGFGSASFAIACLASLFIFIYSKTNVNLIFGEDNISISRFVITVLITPILEEFSIRFLLLDYVSRILKSRLLSATAVSLIFALIHLQDFYPSAIIFFVSLAFSYAYFRKGILCSIIAHSSYNFLILLIPAFFSIINNASS